MLRTNLSHAQILPVRREVAAVGDPAQITGTPGPFFTQGVAGTYDMNRHAIDANSFLLTGTMINGLSFDDSTGILSYNGNLDNSISNHQLVAVGDGGNDTSDTFQIRVTDVIEDFDNLGGNVVEAFNAVGDGAANDTTALQNAFNSDHVVYVPPGRYYYTATFADTTKPKLVWCFGSEWLESNISLSGEDISRLGDQPEFVTDQAVTPVKVSSIMKWDGGIFNMKTVPSVTDEAIFQIDMDFEEAQYGGALKNWCAYGHQGNHIAPNDVDGFYGVRVNFEDFNVDSKFHGWKVFCRTVHMQTAFDVSDYHPTATQDSAGHQVWVMSHRSYRAYNDRVSSDGWYSFTLQSNNNTFNSLAAVESTYAAIILGPRNRGMDYGVQDFGKDGLRHERAIYMGPENALELTNATGEVPVFEQPQATDYIYSDIIQVHGSVVII